MCSCVPSFEQIRFVGSGSEAVSGALRAARATTGRPMVVKFDGHYHGWLDGVYTGVAALRPGTSVAVGQAPSVGADYLSIRWNDAVALDEAFAEHGRSIAAVIMEPLACNGGVLAAARGYLERVREVTRDHGALLVFDEVITGFRVGLSGIQGLSGVTPDLTVVAKAMANGYPIAAFGGSTAAMSAIADNTTVHGGTYNAGLVSVSAARATLAQLQADGTFYERLASLGERLMAGIEERAEAAGYSVQTAGPGAVFHVWFATDPVESYESHLRSDRRLYGRFADALLQSGVRVLPSGRWHLCRAHDAEHVDRALDAAERAFELLAKSSA